MKCDAFALNGNPNLNVLMINLTSVRELVVTGTALPFLNCDAGNVESVTVKSNPVMRSLFLNTSKAYFSLLLSC